MYYYLIVSLIILVVNGRCQAINCFRCDAEEGSCNTGECYGKACVKIETKISGDRDGKNSVNKGCSQLSEDPSCTELKLIRKRALRCVCDYDLCNGDMELINSGLYPAESEYGILPGRYPPTKKPTKKFKTNPMLPSAAASASSGVNAAFANPPSINYQQSNTKIMSTSSSLPKMAVSNNNNLSHDENYFSRTGGGQRIILSSHPSQTSPRSKRIPPNVSGTWALSRAFWTSFGPWMISLLTWKFPGLILCRRQ